MFSKSEYRVLAIIVTHNRLALLSECVNRVRLQTYKTDILVVDNGSNDRTADWLVHQRDLAYVRQRNVGGAGGFHTGIKVGHWLGYDFVWCMDDDVSPERTCLEELVKALEADSPSPNGPPIGWVCSKVVAPDGSIARTNQPVLGDDARVNEFSDAIPARSCSFVSVCIARQAIAAVGLPLRQMFIWLDDVEFTRRITLAGFRGLLIPRSIAIHATATTTGDWLDELGRLNKRKYRYHFRNTALLNRTLSQGSLRRFSYLFAQAVWRATRDLVGCRKWNWLPFAWYWLFAGLFVSYRIDRSDNGWDRIVPDLL